jgi:hypothetical protein
MANTTEDKVICVIGCTTHGESNTPRIAFAGKMTLTDSWVLFTVFEAIEGHKRSGKNMFSASFDIPKIPDIEAANNVDVHFYQSMTFDNDYFMTATHYMSQCICAFLVTQNSEESTRREQAKEEFYKVMMMKLSDAEQNFFGKPELFDCPNPKDEQRFQLFLKRTNTKLHSQMCKMNVIPKEIEYYFGRELRKRIKLVGLESKVLFE